MQLVESHIFKFNRKMDDLCFNSKNIYNSCLYIINQFYIENGEYIGVNNLYHSITKTDTWKSSPLPKKVCNQVYQLAHRNYINFFKALKSYKQDSSKFESIPKTPKYKHSIKGRSVVIYEKGALSKKTFDKENKIELSQSGIKIYTKIKDWDSINQVQLIPMGNHFKINVIYTVPEFIKRTEGKIAAIDIGINNLATVSFSDYKNPFIINGRPLKSINQYYNKKKSKFQSILEQVNKRKSSRRIKTLTYKRNNKINDYLHKSSTILVNQLISNQTMTLIIGKNKGWKTSCNIGKSNNQNFVQIPFDKFIKMLHYKCELYGISVIEQEESYTSKCSFLDNEEIKKHEEYKGRRIKRGLFRSSDGRIINADLNGSYNIMRKVKVIPKFNYDGIEGVGVITNFIAVHPRIINV